MSKKSEVADNEKRLVAAEIIRQLWMAGNDVQLELLRLQIEASMKAIAQTDGACEPRTP